jgi:hypothetical protein
MLFTEPMKQKGKKTIFSILFITRKEMWGRWSSPSGTTPAYQV